MNKQALSSRSDGHWFESQLDQGFLDPTATQVETPSPKTYIKVIRNPI